VIYNELVDASWRPAVSRRRAALVGNYITSLEMAGASITLLELDSELTELWDAPVTRRRSGGVPDGSGLGDGQAVAGGFGSSTARAA